MKKLVTTIALLGLVACIQASMVTITWAPNHSPSGGEFIMTDPAHEFPTFHTFCLEKNEYINVGGTYAYQPSNQTDGGNNGPNDPISIGTAWLYRNFLDGTLPGYTASSSAQTSLQNTFWYLEEECRLSDMTWVNIAQNALGPNVDLFSNANGAFGVEVWNLFTSTGQHAQSQLASTVPDGNTATAGLLGLGLIGLVLLKRQTTFQA